MIFLDWEKAFDRISHQRLFEALERMKINAKMINNIKALYEHPFFKTIHNTEESKWKKTAFWHTAGMSAIAFVYSI
jgi:purine nucleoside phosphorylase